jgi:NADH-quinone oxidoreductase subunit J
LDQIISPFILYGACAVGALGVLLAMPRGHKSLQPIGGLIAAVAGGLAILGLTLTNFADRPNLYFYIFSVIALGGGLRVITHSKPVYAALFFILTILATSGMFLILSAEFMAFALIIVYAGAILITYLFVIMLASQPQTEDDTSNQATYDTGSREPIAAVVVGFILLAALSTLMFRGVGQLEPSSVTGKSDQYLAAMPGRLETVLRRQGLLLEGEKIAVAPDGSRVIDADARTVTLASGTEGRRTIPWPEGLTARNVEGLGMSLIGEHPGTIEIAGVILLMAMLGAVVLSRKQVQLDEEEKRRQSKTLAAALTESTLAAGDLGRGGVR